MKILALIIITYFTLPFGAISQARKLEIGYKGAYYDVFAYSIDSDTINITQFEPWVKVQDLKVSSDSTYFFFRYKREGKAYRLVTYTLDSLKKISESVPGFGGNFEWNEKNQILHSWGCGTNCVNLRVYNKNLEEIFFTLSTAGFRYSPDKTKIAQLSMYYDRIWIFDLRTLDENKIPNGYTQKIEYAIDWDHYKFTTNNLLIIDDIPSHNIDLFKVKWARLNPETIGQFYKRVIEE